MSSGRATTCSFHVSGALSKSVALRRAAHTVVRGHKHDGCIFNNFPFPRDKITFATSAFNKGDVLKRILLAVIAIGVVFAGYLGYQQYEIFKVLDAVTPHVKNTSLRVANSARHETESDSKITYKELFEKLESDISEVDKRLIEVQTLASPKSAKYTDPAIEYLKATQVYLRAMLQKYRKALKLSIAIDWSQQQLDELRDSTSYSYEYAIRSFNKAGKDRDEAMKEYFQEAIPELKVAAKKLKLARAAVSQIYPQDALVPVEQIDAIIAMNTESAASAAK